MSSKNNHYFEIYVKCKDFKGIIIIFLKIACFITINYGQKRIQLVKYVSGFDKVNNITMITFKEYLIESNIATIKNKKISIDLELIKLDDTKHSKERQMRSENIKAVSTNEIISDINKAIPAIINDLANGEIRQSQNVWIHNVKTFLNIIVDVDFKKGVDKIVVITVLRKKNFKSKDRKYVV